jgi:hypothetical protein
VLLLVLVLVLLLVLLLLLLLLLLVTPRCHATLLLLDVSWNPVRVETGTW